MRPPRPVIVGPGQEKSRQGAEVFAGEKEKAATLASDGLGLGGGMG
jgi:hypothetical protein